MLQPTSFIPASRRKEGRLKKMMCPSFKETSQNYLWYLCLHAISQNLVTWPQLASREEVVISSGQAEHQGFYYKGKSGEHIGRNSWNSWGGGLTWKVWPFQTRETSLNSCPDSKLLSMEWASPAQCHLRAEESETWLESMAGVRWLQVLMHLWTSPFLPL